MYSDGAVPLADDSPGCVLETNTRSVQHGREVFWVSLNRNWLSQIGLQRQGALTVHSLATRPVVVRNPSIIIQRAEVDNE